MTPFGTRDARGFFAGSSAGGAGAADEDAMTVAGMLALGCIGGGFISRVDVTAVGRAASSARRYSVLIKSRCFWAAVRFVRISVCSSEF